jgi:hypothetical protein
MNRMKRVLTISLILALSEHVYAQSEIGPEGHKLLWVFLAIMAAIGLAVFSLKPVKGFRGFKIAVFGRKKVVIELFKDRLYYPDNLELTITNNGKSAIDINAPLLIFSGLWYSRKFKLKGTNNNLFYPLYLSNSQSHSLNIDLNRFYGFDKTLKRLPKARIVVSDTSGRHLGTQRVFLRKTLFNL